MGMASKLTNGSRMSSSFINSSPAVLAVKYPRAQRWGGRGKGHKNHTGFLSSEVGVEAGRKSFLLLTCSNL